MLDEKSVKIIRKEYKVVKGKAINVIELSKRFGVPQQRIRDIALGKKDE
jgi:DNA-directed RNA polymerase sigma subunit (sigma70/sigma32)